MFHHRLRVDLAAIMLVVIIVLLIIVLLVQLPWQLAVGACALADVVLAAMIVRWTRRPGR